jgi:hypothetical protein
MFTLNKTQLFIEIVGRDHIYLIRKTSIVYIIKGVTILTIYLGQGDKTLRFDFTDDKQLMIFYLKLAEAIDS